MDLAASGPDLLMLLGYVGDRASRLLVAEDDLVDAESLLKCWRGYRYEYRHVTGAADLRSALAAPALPGIIILDISLEGGETSLDVLRHTAPDVFARSVVLVWSDSCPGDYGLYGEPPWPGLPIARWITKSMELAADTATVVNAACQAYLSKLSCGLEEMASELRAYRTVVGPLPVPLPEPSSLAGVVVSVDEPELPGMAMVRFERAGREDGLRLVPTSRLKAIGAAFPNAQVELDFVECGSSSVSRLRYAGPPREELLARELPELTDEELRELDG